MWAGAHRGKKGRIKGPRVSEEDLQLSRRFVSGIGMLFRVYSRTSVARSHSSKSPLWKTLGPQNVVPYVEKILGADRIALVDLSFGMTTRPTPSSPPSFWMWWKVSTTLHLNYVVRGDLKGAGSFPYVVSSCTHNLC